MGFSAVADVATGSDRAITVVRTATNEIIFKFDYNSGRALAVRPIAIDGVSPETWFAGFRYHGAFQYERRGGGLITVVNFVCVEEYVKGVVPYEMSPSWHIEALKAQAVAARTYGLIYLNRHSAHGFDVCTTEHCQVYRGRNNATAHTDRSVTETSGLVMTHGGRLAAAYYASSHGGASENVENVWLTPLPHLRAVIDPFEASIAHRIPNYNWTLSFTQAEITHRLRDRTSFSGANIVSMEAEYSEVGNIIAIVFRDVNGVPFRLRGRDNLARVLGVRSIRFNIGGTLWTSPEDGGVIYANDPARPISASGFYSIDGYGVSTPIPAGPMLAVDSMGNIEPVHREGGAAAPATSGIVSITNGVTMRGAGWGHNVGMSQWGALAQAELYGRNFRQILQFYFTGVEIQ
jgi:stage II sporulation protein D